MSFWTAILIGILQGATELFPVSSLGHAVVVPPLLGLHAGQSDPDYVPFLVLLHLGTAGALLVLFRREWLGVVTGFLRAATRGVVETADERLAMMLVVGTVPAGLVGFLLEKPVKALFASPRPAAVFLMVNGLLLLGAEQLRRRDERRSHSAASDHEAGYAGIEGIGYRAALLVGTSQALALLPGISRSGVTMAAGLLAGLRHQEAARFSFMLATPIILAAGLLELPELAHPGVSIGAFLGGGLVAGLVAYLSARFLIRYFRTGRLDPYALYCLGLGIVATVANR